MNRETNAAHSNLIAPICAAYPDTQAIYLYGSWGTQHRRDDSDIDIAVLLPHDEAKRVDLWAWAQLSGEVASAAKAERADLINLRDAPIVLCKEVLLAERRIYCADEDAADTFEMLTYSRYQKFASERQAIMNDALKTGRFYDV